MSLARSASSKASTSAYSLDAGNLADDFGGEHPARHGGRDQDFAGGRGQTIKPLPQHEPDALRHRHLIQPQVSTHPAMLVEQHSGLDKVQVNLLNEERVALGLAVDHPHQLLRRRLARQSLQHRAQAVERQSAQAYLFHQAPATPARQ